jgi:hypothetical protein
MTLLAIAYLAQAVVRDWRAMDFSVLRVRPLVLAASILLESAALAWGVSAWGRLIRTVTGSELRLRSLLRVWWSASVARFIPGKVWPFVAAAGGSATTGVSGPLLAATFGLHAALALVTAAVVGAAALERTEGELAGIALSAIALAILLSPLVRAKRRTPRRRPPSASALSLAIIAVPPVSRMKAVCHRWRCTHTGIYALSGTRGVRDET